MLHRCGAGLFGLAVLAWSSRGFADSGPRGNARGPLLTGLSETAVTVRFELPVAGTASVEITPEPATPAAHAPRSFESRDRAAFHEVRIDGLSPATSYRYVVRAAGGRPVGEGRFATAPRPPPASLATATAGDAAPVTFLVYGDDRTDPAAHASVAKAMEGVPADFVVNTGDLVEDAANDDDWRTFFDIEANLLRTRPIFAAIGNHELRHDPTGSAFLRYFGFRDASGAPRAYGTVRYGGVRFFFLDTQHDWTGGQERAWLEQELVRADGEPGVVWRIVVAHEGPWSAGPHGPSERLAAAHVPELLVAHKVDLFLSGHDHLYQRGDGGSLAYIVTGGGGAPLYPVARTLASTRKAVSAFHYVEVHADASAIGIVARRPDGVEIDRCALHKTAGWDCDPPATPPGSASQSGGAPPPASSPSLPPTLVHAQNAAQSGAGASRGCSVARLLADGAPRAGAPSDEARPTLIVVLLVPGAAAALLARRRRKG